MNSANLAVVFGPTLTRAPNNADPRLLHNDVPAINVLIQLCIEKHDYLFGEETEEEGLSSPPPPPPPAESMLGTSPDTAQFLMEPPHPPPEMESSLDNLESPPDLEESDINMEDQTASQEDLETQDDIVSESLQEDSTEPVEVMPVEDVETVSEEVEPVTEVVEPVTDKVEPELEAHMVEEPVETGNTAAQEESTLQPQPGSGLLASQVSTVSVTGDMNFLNQALQDIETSIEEMKSSRPSSTDVPTTDVPTVVTEEDEEDSDSDEDEGNL